MAIEPSWPLASEGSQGDEWAPHRKTALDCGLIGQFAPSAMSILQNIKIT